MTQWGWGATSAERLAGVNPVLPHVLNLARELGCPELTIPPHGGARTLLEQAELVGGGTSWTLNSIPEIAATRYQESWSMVPSPLSASTQLSSTTVSVVGLTVLKMQPSIVEELGAALWPQLA